MGPSSCRKTSSGLPLILHYGELYNYFIIYYTVIIIEIKCSINVMHWGLPWWRSGWDSTCWCKGYGFMPRSRKIPHAVKQLGPWAMAAEPARPEPVLRNGRGHNSERPAYRKKNKNPISEWQVKASSGLPLMLHYGELYNYFIIYYNVIIIEMKCTVNVIRLNQSETIPPQLWKNCLPWNWSLVPESLGTAELKSLRCERRKRGL